MPRLGGIPQIYLSENMLEAIGYIGFQRYPVEACGLLLPTPWRGSEVVELPNRSLDGNNSYLVWPSDIEIAIGEWARAVDHHTRNMIAIWHTHPSGHVGPSRGDMKNRIDGVAYLVVALDRAANTFIPTWF